MEMQIFSVFPSIPSTAALSGYLELVHQDKQLLTLLFQPAPFNRLRRSGSKKDDISTLYLVFEECYSLLIALHRSDVFFFSVERQYKQTFYSRAS